jgi:hypothetical protein
MDVYIWRKARNQRDSENYSHADLRGFPQWTSIYGCDGRQYIGAILITTTMKNHEKSRQRISPTPYNEWTITLFAHS